MLGSSVSPAVLCMAILSSILVSGCQKSEENPATSVQTQHDKLPQETVEKIAKKFADVRPDLVVSDVTKTEVEGLYSIAFSGKGSVYALQDGDYFFTGDLIKIQNKNFVNVKELALMEPRREVLSTISREEMVIFSPEDAPKASVFVFTDVDCGYCRKLHNEVPRLNELGVEVKYLAYPRAGIGSKSYKKIVSAWCAEDKQSALSALKRGDEIPANDCKDNPVANQFELGRALGVTGTPAIVLADGTLLPGYLPADQLAEKIGVQ